MADWQNKKWNGFSKKESAPEDFVLYGDRDLEMAKVNEEAETETTEIIEEDKDLASVTPNEMDETRVLSSEDLQAALEEKDNKVTEDTGSIEPIRDAVQQQEKSNTRDYVAQMAAAAITAEEEKAAKNREKSDTSEAQQEMEDQAAQDDPAKQWWEKMTGKEESASAEGEAFPIEEKETGIFRHDSEAKYRQPILNKRKMTAFSQEHKASFLIVLAGVLAVGLIAGLIFVLTGVCNPLKGYEQVSVEKGNVMSSIDREGKLEANAHYNIISLVAGTVEESVPEPGDEVREGEVLYRLDDAEAKLAVERAENQLNRTKALATASTGTTIGKIYATEAGTIQTFSISKGSKVTPGQVVGTVKREDGSVGSIVSAMTGTIDSVRVSRGSTVQAGSLVATLREALTDNTQKTNTYDQKSDQIDISSAKEQLERYVIKSPISGVVVEKNIRKGDVVAMTDTDNPMMVLVDMNSMRLTVQVDEYMVRSMKVGQKALINAEALPEETFGGEVTRISTEGYEGEEGKTVYDVDITIDDPGNLKGGMKVKAEIILASATNVLTLPREALMEADGQNALVLVRADMDAVLEDQIEMPTEDVELEPSEDVEIDLEDIETWDEELVFPWIKVPKGCRLVTVKYGIADDRNVQIVSGLQEGAVVVYDPKLEQKELIPTTLDESFLKGEEDPLGQEDDYGTAIPGSTKRPNDVDDDAVLGGEGMSEEEIKRQIMEKIKSHPSSGQS